MPVTAANANAWPRDMRPAGRGLWAVRFIRASLYFSYTWLRALAEEEARAVPREVHPIPTQSMVSVLPAAYPAAEVSTTSALSLNLDSCL